MIVGALVFRPTTGYLVLPGGLTASAAPTCSARLTRDYGPPLCGPGGSRVNRVAWTALQTSDLNPRLNTYSSNDPGRPRRTPPTPGETIYTMCEASVTQNEVMQSDVGGTSQSLRDDRDVWTLLAKYYGWKDTSFPVAKLRREGCFGVCPPPGT